MQSPRLDLLSDVYAKCKDDKGNNWVLIILFEPEEPNTTVEIGAFYSLGQILERLRKDGSWVVNEKYGKKLFNDLTQSNFLPMRSDLPPIFAYGPALQKFEDLADFYDKKAKQLEEELKEVKTKNNPDEPKQLTAPKDPKSRPN